MTRAEIAMKEETLIPRRATKSEGKKGVEDGNFSLGEREEAERVLHDLPFFPKRKCVLSNFSIKRSTDSLKIEYTISLV